MEKSEVEKYFDKTYAETFPAISRYVVSKCGSLNDAEDILQEVYSRFYLRITKKGYDDIECIEAFLISIAKFECRSYFGSIKKQPKTSSVSDMTDEQLLKIEAEMSLGQKKLEDVLCNSIMAKQIYDDVVSTDELTGKIFFLHFVSDMTLESVAGELDIPLSTVKNKLYRTIEKIKNKYNI